MDYNEADKPVTEDDEICPFIERIGVCLEPEACFLRHTIWNTNSVEFKPKPKEGGESKPSFMEMFAGMGMDYDAENNICYFEKSKDCTCCSGYINNCNGEACKFLGFCHCVAEYSHQV